MNKRIWYVSKYANHPKYGNPSRQYFFSKYFSLKGHNTTLISSCSATLRQHPKLGFKNHLNYQDEELNCVLVNGPKIKLGFNLKRILSWLVFELRFLFYALFYKKEKPDIIIVSSLSILTFLSGSILKKQFKCKLICEVRDIWPLTIIETKNWSERNIFIKFLTYIEYIGYKNADIIIGSMPNLKEHVEHVNPKFKHKVYHVPMGYDPVFYSKNNFIKNDPFKDIIKEKVPNGNFVVGYAGSIGYNNCVDQIIAAASNLNDESISFLLLGDGTQKEILKKDVQKQGLANVIFIDRVEKEYVQLFLQKCDVLLHPVGVVNIYRYGLSPNKWIDYMYSSRPIIVSYNGFQSIINEAECGKFIEANNPDVLAQTILDFSNMKPEKLNEMGKRGRQYLENKLNYDVLSDYYLEIIDKV